MDPKAEDFNDVTPYNYAMNNPILMIDPDGMEADSVPRVTPVVVPPKPAPSTTTIVPVLPVGVNVVTGILLDEVVVTATPVLATIGEGITTVVSAPFVFIGAMLLPQNFQQEWVHDEIPQTVPLLPPVTTYTPPPRALSGFPDAVRVPNKGRARWKNPDGRILEWDSQHGDVEVYNSQGKHEGSADPNTGESTKPAVPGRTTRK